MALGAIMFSMPAALLGSFYVSALHGFGAAQGLAAYALFGAVFLIAVTLLRGLAQD